MEDQLSEIIKDIYKENCVLIIGPDICDFGDKSFFEVMCDDCLNNNQYKDIFDYAPQYVFLNEELLQLKTGIKEITVLKMMQEFYQKQTVFDDPLLKISQIPFHLIISLMPDDRLKRIFTEQKLDFNYGYYPTNEVFKKIPEKPSKQTPLIYNLLGDFEERDVVITFADLFSFLSNIMKHDLPDVIQESLKKASSFIFLGVHFERWHAQLLLKLIISKGLNYTISKNGNNDDVSLFVGRRLELELLGNDPLDFLNNIYQSCKTKGLLKSIPARARVFISYSHKDMAVVKAMVVILKTHNIEVIMDESHMAGGQKINDFISKIENVDFVIPIISQFSLFSRWVIKEINTCLEEGKKLLPYCLDETISNKDINETALNVARSSIREINQKIQQNEMGNIDDLVIERKMWSDYNLEFPTVLKELKGMKYRQIDEANLPDSVQLMIQDIDSTK
ncbi:MAG: hypothetical protein JWP37_55 [Mucilaginibacter sp.]|nr:hypothetical protein [Mucilaginibacter sp.]